MKKFESPLSNLKIASPCSADWEQMYGNERKRFCGDCKLNVYNLSDMTKQQAEDLISGSEGRLCVRFYQREDGTVITQDCPVGWAKVKQKLGRAATAVFSLFATIAGGFGLMGLFQNERQALVGELVSPYSTSSPTPTPKPETRYPIMGALPAPDPTKEQPKPTPKPDAREMVGRPELNPKRM